MTSMSMWSINKILMNQNVIRRSKGFTLLEVMVSLIIIATAFAAVLRLHSDSMEMVINSRVQTKAEVWVTSPTRVPVA